MKRRKFIKHTSTPDGGNGWFLNAPEADEFLHREYREGWVL